MTMRLEASVCGEEITMPLLKTAALWAAMPALILSSPAMAGCWTAAETVAAKVSELNILLNVQSLRCRNEDSTIQDGYYKFQSKSRAGVSTANKLVKAHFKGNSKLFDNYAISVANKYGAGKPDQTCSGVATLMLAATGKKYAELAKLADSSTIEPVTPGGQCVVKAKSAGGKARKGGKRRKH
jgi:hypothetical protein